MTELEQKIKVTEDKIKQEMSSMLASIGNLYFAYKASDNEDIYNSYKYLTSYVLVIPEEFINNLEADGVMTDVVAGFNGTVTGVEGIDEIN